MKLFDFFKKRKKREKEVKRAEEREVKKTKELKEKIEEKPAVSSVSKPKRKEVKVAHRVLKSAQITEKASDLRAQNQYVFRVFPRANKPEIKKAIEEVYGVDVLQVRTIKVPRKQKRLGRTRGWRQGYKKAIVSVKQGQSIEVLPR